MPHIDITMIPGRDDTAKKELAVKIQGLQPMNWALIKNLFLCLLKILQKKIGMNIYKTCVTKKCFFILSKRRMETV